MHVISISPETEENLAGQKTSREPRKPAGYRQEHRLPPGPVTTEALSPRPARRLTKSPELLTSPSGRSTQACDSVPRRAQTKPQPALSRRVRRKANGGLPKFAKRTISETEARRLAQLRCDDARVLLTASLKRPACSASAFYLAGIAIEVCLKALVLRRHPRLRAEVDQSSLSRRERDVYREIYTKHDLVRLVELTDVDAILCSRLGDQRGKQASIDLRSICPQWKPAARYHCDPLPSIEVEFFVERAQVLTKVLSCESKR